MLDVIYAFKRTDVVAVEDDFAFELIPVLLDLVVFYHDDDEVNVIEELIEVVELVLNDVLLDERVVALQGTSEVTLLALEHLKCWTFAVVVNILFVGETIKTYSAVVGDAVFFHDFVNTIEHILGLAVVGFHGLVNNLCETWIVAYEEPWVNAYAVATYARARLQDVYARVHVADLDDFVNIHVVVAADASQFVGKGDVHSAEGIFYYFRHFSTADVGNNDFALAERSIVFLYFFTDGTIVGTDGAVVMEQLIDHIAWNDALGSVNEVDVFANFEAVFFNNGTHEVVYRTRADGAFNNDCCTFGAYAHHFFHGGNYVAGIDFL